PHDVAVPLQSIPTQRRQDLLGRSRHDARRVDVLDPYQPAATRAFREEVRTDRGDEAAEVERAGGGGSETAGDDSQFAPRAESHGLKIPPPAHVLPTFAAYIGHRKEAQMLIRLTNVNKSYRLGRVLVRALDGVDLDVDRGDFLALAGPSGSGKTTLLNLIGCIDKPNGGRVVIDGVDVTAVPLHRLAATRRDALGYIFQTFNLIPVLTAYENVEY